MQCKRMICEHQRTSAQRDAYTARPPQSLHRRTESAMAVVSRSQNFRPAADPFPGAQDRQNLISWRRSLPAPSLVKIDARNFELSW